LKEEADMSQIIPDILFVGDKTVWMLIGGVIAATVVLVWTLRNWKQD
jgi:hypothetical protein